eukprot:1161777-Pelagomonas_calceolata.AAC.1
MCIASKAGDCACWNSPVCGSRTCVYAEASLCPPPSLNSHAWQHFFLRKAYSDHPCYYKSDSSNVRARCTTPYTLKYAAVQKPVESNSTPYCSFNEEKRIKQNSFHTIKKCCCSKRTGQPLCPATAAAATPSHSEGGPKHARNLNKQSFKGKPGVCPFSASSCARLNLWHPRGLAMSGESRMSRLLVSRGLAKIPHVHAVVSTFGKAPVLGREPLGFPSSGKVHKFGCPGPAKAPCTLKLWLSFQTKLLGSPAVLGERGRQWLIEPANLSFALKLSKLAQQPFYPAIKEVEARKFADATRSRTCTPDLSVWIREPLVYGLLLEQLAWRTQPCMHALTWHVLQQEGPVIAPGTTYQCHLCVRKDWLRHFFSVACDASATCLVMDM